MKIRDLFQENRRLFSFEFFPPKSDAGMETLTRTIGDLEDLQPAFVSVTYGAGGTTRDRTVDLVARIEREHAITAMAHLTCVGASRSEIADGRSDQRTRAVRPPRCQLREGSTAAPPPLRTGS